MYTTEMSKQATKSQVRDAVHVPCELRGVGLTTCKATDRWEHDPKSSQKNKIKNIQQRGFASGHPPDY
jgi:hypothetical protein